MKRVKQLHKKTLRISILSILIMLVSMQLQAQKTITGIVSDDTGPLPGASVVIKGTNSGTETDFDGKYSIEAKEGAVLQFSYIGMETVLKTVGKKEMIHVIMETNSEEVLKEIIKRAEFVRLVKALK